MITINRGNLTVAVVQPDESVVQQKEISGLNLVRLTFTLPFFVHFMVEDWAMVFGETYYITMRPIVVKEGNRNYAYTLDMEGEQYKLGRALYMQENVISQYFNNPFFINDKAEVMMTLLLRNVQRVFPDDGWKLGFVEDTEIRNVQFDGMNCLEVLNLLAEQFETEWLIEGRTIHLYRRTNAVNHIFRQGENEALYSITQQPQDNSNKVNRLYVYGGSKNLPANYRNGRTRLSIGAIPYIEGDTSDGVWEDSVIFDDIIPVNNGEVSGVTSNPLQFIDTAIPFNVNGQLMDGVTAKVTFETGQLAGYEFEISSFNNTTKTFTINKNTQESAIDIPSEALKPTIGDKYFVFDIRMPNELTEQAEDRLRIKGQQYMDERNNPQNNEAFTVACNPLYFKRNGVVLRLADGVLLKDDEMGIDTFKRVIKITRSVRNPHLYTAELANRVKENKLVKLLSQL